MTVMAIIPGDEEESVKRVEAIVEKFGESQEGMTLLLTLVD